MMRKMFAIFDCHNRAFLFHSLLRCFFFPPAIQHLFDVCQDMVEKNLVDISFDRIFSTKYLRQTYTQHMVRE